VKIPERLLESSPNPLTRELLRSGLPDAPGPDGIPRILGAAGLVGTLGASTAATGSVLGALGKGGASALAAKWLGIGLVVGAASGGGFAAMAIRSTDRHAVRRVPAEESSAASPSNLALGPRAARSVAEWRLDEPAPPAAERPTLPEGLAESRARQATTAHGESVVAPAAADRSSQLAADVKFIDRAKQRLGRGDAAGTLRELEAYGKSHRTGALDREALVLQVEALVLAGKRAEATEVVRGYLERFPEDAYTRRLRRLVGPDPGPAGKSE
jgi:hypothetical protein